MNKPTVISARRHHQHSTTGDIHPSHHTSTSHLTPPHTRPRLTQPPFAGTTNTSALDYRDYASWRACRSSNAPMLMMDMAYPYTTMTFFGTNNMLGLIYNTLLITSAISIAMLPVPRGMFNLWVIVAELVLMGNFIGMMAIPFTNTAMHLPPNNAILISVFHLITMVVILALARPRDEERSLNDVKGEDNKWKLVLRYLGTHLVRGGRYGNMGAHVNVYQRPSTGQVMYVEKGGGESIPGGADIPTGVVVEGGDKGDSKVVASIVNTSKGSIAALNPKGVLEDDFAEFLVNRMSMITVRYFEYSMTAGLFLVSVMLVIYPTANVHLYHIVFQVAPHLSAHHHCRRRGPAGRCTDTSNAGHDDVQPCCHPPLQGDRWCLQGL